MFEELYTQPKRPQLVGIRLDPSPEEWDNAIVSQINNVLDTSQYQLSINYKKIDPKRGNAVGNISITYGNKVGYIPLIIHDFYLQGLDIFEFEGKAYPLRQDLVKKLLSDNSLMLSLKDYGRTFPTFKHIEGGRLIRDIVKTSGLTLQEKKDLMSKVSEDYKFMVENLKVNLPKLASLNIDRVGLDRYKVDYTFYDGISNTAEVNYKVAKKMMDKLGASINTQIPYRLDPQDQSKANDRVIFKPHFTQLLEEGNVITSDGQVIFGYVRGLIGENAKLKGYIFVSGKNYATRKAIFGFRNAGSDSKIQLDNAVNKAIPGSHPKKGELFFFEFDFENSPKVFMGPYVYLYTKKIQDNGREETHIYATRPTMEPLEFVVTNHFGKDLIQRKGERYYIPPAVLYAVDNELQLLSDKAKGGMLIGKLASLGLNVVEISKISEDKYMFRSGSERKIIDKEERERLLKNVRKEDKSSPIFMGLISPETKREISEAKEKKQDRPQEETEKSSELKTLFNTIRENDFLKEAEELHFDEGVDVALGLNLLTPQRINEFVQAIPDFWHVLHMAGEMLLAARLGLKELNADLIKSLMDKLYNVIVELSSLRNK